MTELYQIESLLEDFEKRINNKLEKLEYKIDIILKKIKDDDKEVFETFLLGYRYDCDIVLQHNIREKLKSNNIDTIKVDKQKQIIYLTGSMVKADFLAKNIIPERFVDYTESS